jgi:thiol-disulfide isomerase/thioredoxin
MENKTYRQLLLYYIYQKMHSVLSKAGFQRLLENNPGHVVIKFGAEWCGPCKRVEGLVKQWFAKKQSAECLCIMVDVDESFELYGMLKSKRVVNGIPTILCYNRGNITFAPNAVTTGADEGKINAFFNSF